MEKKKKIFLLRKYGRLLSWCFRLLNRNKCRKAKGNNFISLRGIYSAHSSFTISGEGNSIRIIPGITRFKNCTFTIKGNNNRILIEKDCNLNNCHLYIEDNGGFIHIGEHTTITGNTDIAVIEGCKVEIGKDCLLSSDIVLRTGDSHSVIDAKTKERVNMSMDITIGEHVWIGHSVKVLKGVKVGNHSIIATGAILTKRDYHDNVIIGGIGGKVLREGIDWCSQRLPFVN
jgi:acetyltransferase-like isoleucine patch superfamily enzyme